MTPDAVGKAVEIIKAAIPSENGVWVNNPDQVAKFIDVIASKIHELNSRKG